jgi:hypothetical protein
MPMDETRSAQGGRFDGTVAVNLSRSLKQLDSYHNKRGGLMKVRSKFMRDRGGACELDSEQCAGRQSELRAVGSPTPFRHYPDRGSTLVSLEPDC